MLIMCCLVLLLCFFSFEKCRRIQIDKNIKIDRIFHILFLEDDVGRKWIKIDKSRRVL